MANGALIVIAIPVLLVIIMDALQFLLSPKAQELRPPASLWKIIVWIAVVTVLVTLVTWSLLR